MINLSNTMSMAGRMRRTDSQLTIAPLHMRPHIELMISIPEYTDTPKVAAKNPIALTVIDGADMLQATLTASRAVRPESLSFLYLVVIRIA